MQLMDKLQPTWIVSGPIAKQAETTILQQYPTTALSQTVCTRRTVNLSLFSSDCEYIVTFTGLTDTEYNITANNTDINQLLQTATSKCSVMFQPA